MITNWQCFWSNKYEVFGIYGTYSNMTSLSYGASELFSFKRRDGFLGSYSILFGQQLED